MTNFVGWFNVKPGNITSVNDFLNNNQDDKKIFVEQNNYSQGVALYSTNQFSSHSLDDEKLTVVVKGHPFWPGRDSIDIAASIGNAYLTSGPAFIDKLSGHFCIVLIDKTQNKLLLFTDRLATYPILFTRNEEEFYFGSNLTSLKPLIPGKLQIDSQQIFNYLYFHAIPGPKSIYKNIEYIPPGHIFTIENGNVRQQNYWKPQYSEHQQATEQELKDEFLDVLNDAVKNSSQNYGRIGCFLSGGTDSSTVSGKLAALSDEPIHTFSIGFDAKGYDEMEFARIASKHFGTSHHEYYVTPDDVVTAIPKIAACYDSPFGNSSAVPTYYCAKLAKSHGIDTLLGGDGGDELFGGNERYLKQLIFSRYENIPALARKVIIEPLILKTPLINKITLLQKAQSYITQANVEMPLRLQTYNLLKRIGTETIFTTTFLQGINQSQPESDLKNHYSLTDTNNILYKMLALDFKYTLSDSDLPKVTKMSELAGVNVAFPLLDNQLIDFSTRLPSDLMIKNNQLRYFFKNSLKDFLPNEIITKSKHGFGLPFGPWLKDNKRLREITLDSLQSLKKRDIVQADFIDKLTNNYVNEHAGYYGTMIWILMMLEQWFKHNED